MRILLLADGSSVHTARYQAELKAQGVDVVLASLERGDTVDINIPAKTGIKVFDYVLAGKLVKRLLKEYSPDIINPHFAVGYGFLAALSGVRKNRPILLHCLGSDILVSPHKSVIHKRRAIYALSRADVIMVDSEYLDREVKKLCPKAECKIVAWGADSEAFELFERKNHNASGLREPLRIIVPRAHYKIYNNRFIIESLSDLANNNRVTITFPDWGDELNAFSDSVDRLCPGEAVQYYGFKTRAEFNPFLSDFDIYLSASYSDSSPVSLIEAMAAGLYPVVGDIPGVREWITNENGSLFDLKDKDSLNRAILNLLENPPEMRMILDSNHAKAKAEGMFKNNVKATIAIMEEMIVHAGSK
jgi:glycosyltransferase involved in cell wall biosynthesis